MADTTPRYIVFHHGTLGDWVVTFPLWRNWQPLVAVTHWSRAKVASSLLGNVSPMDCELREFVRLHMEGGPAALSPAVAELFEQVEGIISFISDGQDQWADNVRRLVPGSRLACIDPRQPEGASLPMAEHYARQLAAQGIDVDLVQPPLKGTPKGPVVIHPGSGGEPKCWPVDRFCKLADKLAAAADIHFVVGEAEIARWPDKQLNQLESHGKLIRCDSLEALLDQIQSAKLYIGNDAGPTHLAAQCGKPTVALFGPTDAKIWQPTGPAVTVVAPDEPCSMDWLTVEPVAKACLTWVNL